GVEAVVNSILASGNGRSGFFRAANPPRQSGETAPTFSYLPCLRQSGASCDQARYCYRWTGTFLLLAVCKPKWLATRELGNAMSPSDTLDKTELAKPAQSRLKITFWLDIALLVSVCALQTVSFTGLFLHEWLGLAMIAMVLAHLLFAWTWI